MYFIMDIQTDVTIATTAYEDVAETIAKTFGADKCIVRWASTYNNHKTNKTLKEVLKR